MKILVVEDEKELAQGIAAYLRDERYTCDIAPDYKTAVALTDDFAFDCILLDISLPDGNGLKLLEHLKADNKTDGVIVISAKASIEDRIAGLNLGADDYLTKPFHLSELSARVAAVIRRRRFDGQHLLTLPELSIDLVAKTVTAQSQLVDLTRTEYDLLLYLASNKNRVVSKNAIAEHLNGSSADSFDNADVIYAHMKNLKRKLAAAGVPDFIRSVYGLGYKLVA